GERGVAAMAAPPRLFCFGLGYTALMLARRLQARGWAIAGTCQSAARQAELAREGITAHLFDPAEPLPDPASALAGATHLLSSVPPDAAGDVVLDCHAGAIAAHAGALAWA